MGCKQVKIKYTILGIVFIVLVIGIPLIIDNWIIGNDFQSNISNSDWVSFLGSYIGAILGGLFTLVAIYITYNQNNKLHSENANSLIEMKRLDVMPFMDMKIEKSITEEYFSKPMFCVILNGDGTYSTASSNIDIAEFHEAYRGNMHWVYLLKNIGNNSAHSMQISLNDNIIDFGTHIEKGKTKTYHLLIPRNMKDIKLNFRIEFFDIYNNKYAQKFTYEEIYKNEKTKSCRVGQVTSPEIL
jgi:hypothetical protein